MTYKICEESKARCYVRLRKLNPELHPNPQKGDAEAILEQTEVPYFEVLAFFIFINTDCEDKTFFFVNSGWGVLLARRSELVKVLHKEELRRQDCEDGLA